MRKLLNNYPILIVIAVMMFGSCSVFEKPIRPSVVRNGILDLKGWDLKKDGPVALTGDWEFYWNRLLVPGDFRSGHKPVEDGLVSLPDIWNHFRIKGKKLPSQGVATFRVVIDRDAASAVARKLALRLKSVETSYRVYVNGDIVGSAGRVGRSAQVSVPAYKPQVLDFTAAGSRIEIIIQVANFYHYKGGLDSIIYFGTESDLREKKQQSLFVDVFIFGSVLIMSLYHLGLYLLRREDLSLLFFGILCFFISFRSILVGDYFILRIFPNIAWNVLLVLEYLTFTIALPAFAMFIHSLFPEEFSKTALRLIQGLSLIYLLIVLLTPARFFSQTVVYFQILILASGAYGLVVLGVAIYRNRPEARYVFAGTIILLAVSINDVLHNNLIIHTGIVFPMGLFVVVIIQAYMLSLRFSNTFKELDHLKQSLEMKVDYRTRELREKNDQMNQLVHILCHDLQNPLANIKSIIELIEEDPTNWNDLKGYVRTATNNGMEIIEMVKKLEALDENKMRLSLQPYNLAELVAESIDVISQKLEQKQIGIQLAIDREEQVIVEKTAFVNSVLINILTNAIKFSPNGSTIELSTRRNDVGSKFIDLVVRDHGIGMSEKLLQDIFNPHKTTSRTGTNGETGTGFGMPLVKRFMTAFGGEITVSSIEKRTGVADAGTEIQLRLRRDLS